MARYCVEEGDMDCAQKNWEQVLQLDQKNLAAYHGLAQIAWQKKDKATAIRWLRQGQAQESKYIPYNILANQIGPLDSEQ
jgi:Tfp pilus assembly protein PilF